MPAKYFVAPSEPIHIFADREICNANAAGKREYYLRIRIMSARQDELCAICRQFMISPTFDHEAGRGMSAGFRNDAITDAEGNWVNAALCHDCNGEKGSKRYHWLNGAYVPTEN